MLGHSRWASLSPVNIANCHPILSKFGEVILVHNGTLTNYQNTENILSKLNNKSYWGKTDTEVLTDFIEDLVINNDIPIDEWKKEIDKAFGGTYAIAFLVKDSDRLFWMTKDVALYYYEGRLASETSLLPAYFPLPNNSWGFIEQPGKRARNPHFADSFELNINGKNIINSHSLYRNIRNQQRNLAFKDKDLMLNEIKQQVMLAYDYYEQAYNSNIAENDVIRIVGCGSSYHAGLLGKKYSEIYNYGVDCEVYYSSEYRLRDDRGRYTRYICITQSGETADSLEILREWKECNNVMVIVNKENSTASLLAHEVFKMEAGEEVAVAATKSFTTTSMILLALFCPDDYAKLDLNKFRENIANCIELLPQIQKIVTEISQFKHYMVFGSGLNFPISCETALKLTEVARINCQGLPCEAFKHGSIALASHEFLGITFFPDKDEPKYDRVLNSVNQTKARDGFSLGIGPSVVKECDWFIKVPKDNLLLQPLLNNIVGQLLAYSLGKFYGYNVDSCRNCSKSITVY